MSYKKILVPYDESDHAKAALLEAVKIAAPDTMIQVIEVSAPPQDLVYSSMNQTSGFTIGVVTPPENFAELVSARTEEATARLTASVNEVIGDCECTVTAEVIYGIYTVETILDTAKDSGCDLIAMGCRGLGAIRGALGSVSYAVLRSAEVPVLVVK